MKAATIFGKSSNVKAETRRLIRPLYPTSYGTPTRQNRWSTKQKIQAACSVIPFTMIMQGVGALLAIPGNVPSVFVFSQRGTVDFVKLFTNNATLLYVAGIVGIVVGVLATAVALPWTVINLSRWVGVILARNRFSFTLLCMSIPIFFSATFNGVNTRVSYGSGKWSWIGFLFACLPGLGNALAIQNNLPDFMDDAKEWGQAFKKCMLYCMCQCSSTTHTEKLERTHEQIIAAIYRIAVLQLSNKTIKLILQDIKKEKFTEAGDKADIDKGVKALAWVLAYLVSPILSLTFAVSANINAIGVTKDGMLDMFGNVDSQGLDFFSTYCALSSFVFQTFLWYMLFQNVVFKPLIRYFFQDHDSQGYKWRGILKHVQIVKIVKLVVVPFLALCYGIMNLSITLMDKELTNVVLRFVSAVGSISGNWVISMTGLFDLGDMMSDFINQKIRGKRVEKDGLKELRTVKFDFGESSEVDDVTQNQGMDVIGINY